MPDPAHNREYVRADSFFCSPRTTTIAQDVREQTRAERATTVLDMSSVRRQEAWSLLADKTVGAEGA